MRSYLACILIITMFLSTALTCGVTTEFSSGEPTRAVPTPPLNFTVVAGNGQVSISWDDPQNFNGIQNGFNLYRSLTQDFGPEAYANLGRFQYSYRDTSVTNGKTYYYAAAAINLEEGAGELTDPIAAKPVGRPTKPRNITTTYGSNQVSFSWLPPEDDGGSPVIGYAILRGISSSALDSRVNITNITDYDDDTVKNGVPYIYRILAFNERLDGTPSGEISVTPRGRPGDVGNLTLEDLDREVMLNWSYPEDDGGISVSGYVIHRGASGASMDIYDVIGTEEQYLDDNITSGIEYFYAVQAVNPEGNGTISDPVIITPLNVPAGALNMSAEPRDGSAYLTWRAPDDDGGVEIDGYNLYRTLKGLEMQLIADLGDVLEYMDTNLTNQETYYYQVRAYNDLGIGYPSDTVSVKPDVLPNPPGNFRMEEGDGKLRILWTQPQLLIDYPIQKFNLYRGLSNDSLEIYQVLPNSQNTFTDNDVEIGQIYHYMIQSISRIGEGPLSRIISGIPFTTPGPIRDLDVVGGDKKVTISWTPPEFSGGREIISYVIFRGNTPDDMGSIFTVTGNATSYVDDKVTNGNRYFYGVKSVNEELDGDVIGKVEVFPLGPPTVPKNVVSQVEGDSIMISWTPPLSNGGRPVQGYKILRGSSDLDLVEITSVGLVENYTDDTIEKGVEYYYSVKAFNEIGDSVPSRSTINMIVLPPPEEKQGISPALIILPIIIVLMIAIAIIAAIVYSKKKKEEEEKAKEIQLEESELQRERRLTEERRKQAAEFTDVSLTSEEAHAHDQDEHAYAYDKLYSDKKADDGAEASDQPVQNEISAESSTQEAPAPPQPDVALPEQPPAEMPTAPQPIEGQAPIANEPAAPDSQ